VTVVACGGGTHDRGSSTPSAGATPSTSVPNPFTIVARYSAEALGLTNDIGIAVGPDGNVYVTDGLPGSPRQRVNVISPEGKVLRRWGKRGSGQGEFDFITSTGDPTDAGMSVAIDRDGLVYVSDSGNTRIEVFTPQGWFLRQLGSRGEHGPHKFLGVGGLAVDASANLYVEDGGRHTISKFSPRGKFLWRIGGPESPDPDLHTVEYLATVDVHGRMVLPNDEGRIVYVDGHGRKVDAFGSRDDFPGGLCSVTVDGFGYVYADSCGPNPADTRVFDRDHTLVGEWSGPSDPLRSSPLFAPNGDAFALGWDGSLLRLKVVLPGA